MTKKKWKVLKVHFDAPALIEDALNRLDDEGYKNTKSERPNILRNKL